MVGQGAAGHHCVELLAGLGAGGQAVHAVGRDALSGVHGARVPQLGGLCQHLVVAGTPGVHCVEDEVGGAVDDAHHLVDLVAGKGAPKRANHRDGCGNGGLEE